MKKIRNQIQEFRVTLLRHGLGDKLREELAEQIDYIEVFNSRSIISQPSIEARLFAEKYGIPVSAGSDAHNIGEVGKAYVEMPEFNGKDEFLNALRKGRIVGRRTSPLVHFGGTWASLKRRLQR